MLTVFAWVTIQEEHANEFLSEFAEVAAATRQEEGCHRYDIHQQVDHPGQFYFYEVYDDAGALATHGQSEHFQRFFDEVKPWIAEGPTGVQTQKLSI